MIIYGAGGHAKVIVDMLQSTKTKVYGIIDDNPNVTRRVSDIPFLGNYTSNTNLKHPFIIAIGDNKTRKNIACQIHEDFKSVIHDTAIISTSANIGQGTCIMANTTINAATKIGKHCIINTGAVIDHDCDIDNFIHIAPNATITGEVTIGEGTFIGAGAVVIPGVKIGKWAVIGAGATVIENVPDYAVVVGCPGKVIKFNP